MEVLEPSEFLAEAQALAVGEKRKVRHLCGDASLVVYNNVDSWSAWCWRCHARGWVAKPQPSMAERLQRQRQQEAIDNALRSDVQAPRPANHDFGSWPLAARLWLLKAGLTPQLIGQLGAYYHAGSDRVVLPVRAQGSDRVVFWQARNCNYPVDGRPKYISQSSNRSGVHCIYPQQHQAGADKGSDTASATAVDREDDGSTGGAGASRPVPIVLTEDILSAFKVAATGRATGYAIMGTVLAPHTTDYLLRCGLPVKTWFDPDAAGEDARRHVRSRLRYIGIECEHIRTTQDPKRYCLREIREHLQ